MRNGVYQAALMLAMLFLWLLPAAAQVEVGENVNLSLGGSLSVGYNGAFGNTNGSTHGMDFGGYSWLRGSYYDPKFLSFDFQPYYRRSQDNSIYQSITDGSGFTGNVNLFSGSHFPGSVTYSRQYDSTGQFGVPGVSGITSHGNGQGFGINWSALLPDLPTLSASFATNSGSSSVYGANDKSESGTRNFTLQSTYRLDGFDLQGQYSRLSTDATFPAFFQGGETQQSSTGSNTYNVTAGHRLPYNGYWSAGWSRSSYVGNYTNGTASGSNSGVVNDFNSMVALNPMRKLGLSFGADYNDNTYGTFQEQILQAGGAPLPSPDLSWHRLTTNVQATYSVFSHLSLYARANHYELWYPDGNRGLTQFSGNAAFNFAHRLLGSLTFTLGVMDTASEEGNSGASLFGSVGALRRVHGWEVGGDFSYMQQVETLVGVYSTSMYRYGANAKRRFGDLHWTTSFNGSHSGLQQFAGSSSRGESYSTSFAYHRYGLSGNYSQSTGTSILTPTGLVEIPGGVPAPLITQPILYNGKSYGGGASFRPFRRCAISAAYQKAISDTSITGRATAFGSTIYNARLEYDLRKLKVDANFTRFQQSVNTGVLPTVVNSYYIRFSRWFNIF